MFANTSDCFELSETLQRAHSDFWLGPDFPSPIGNLSLDFSADLDVVDLVLNQGTMYYKGVPLQPESIVGHRRAKPIAGLSMNPVRSEISVELEVGGKRTSVYLGAGFINHKLSLVRILDAWGVPVGK